MKMSNAHKGKAFSVESRNKMSEASKGKKKSDEHKSNMSNAHKGKRHINKNGSRKMVKPEQLKSYLDDGWKLGRNND